MSSHELTSGFPSPAQRESNQSAGRRSVAYWFGRFSPSQGWATLGFLAIMLVVVGQSILAAGWVETPGLVFGMLLGAAAGTALAKVRLPWFLLMPLGLIIGAGIVIFSASTGIDGPSVSDRLRETLARLDAWYGAASSGGISTDLLPFTIMLLSAAWLLGFFSAWFVFRRNNVWIGVVSAGVMLLTNLSFLPDKFAIWFFGFIFVAMLLIVRVSVIQRHETWRGLRIRFRPTTGWLTIHASLWFIALVLVVAALLPLQVIRVQKAANLWNMGRTPVARVEEVFTRLFATLPSRKDLAGRFFGSTLPFTGRIAFGGDVVAWADSEYPSYWLSKVYSEYTSPGWIAAETEPIEVGPEILPPPRTDTKKRAPVDQTLQLGFSTEKYLSGGDFDWVSRSATLHSLLPKTFTIDVQDASADVALPDDIQELASKIRVPANLTEPTSAYAFVSRLLPPDLVLLELELEEGVGTTAVRVQRKAPIAPDIVAWDFDAELAEDDAYRMTSIVSTATDDDLRGAETTYNRFVTDHYLQLPASLPQRVRELSLDVTAGQDNPLDKALAVQEFLRGPTFSYSQDIEAPPRDSDGVDNFLFETQEGYSDYFASSMAVLLRAAGVPTRLAAGYAPGELDEESGHRFIKDSDSHGWVQVYFPAYGWIDFEPTPNWEVHPRIPGGAEAAGLAATAGDLDSDGIIAGDPGEFFDEEELFGLTGDSGVGATLSRNLTQYLTPIAIVVAILALMGLSARFWLSYGLGGLSPEARLYAKMGRLGLIARVRHRSSQTPWEYATVVGLVAPDAADAAWSIANSYAASRYGGRQPDVDGLTELQAAWKQVRRSLVGRAIRRLAPEPSPRTRQQGFAQ